MPVVRHGPHDIVLSVAKLVAAIVCLIGVGAVAAAVLIANLPETQND
jgi:hypothetical protein